jgi:hypothetical protein
MDSLQSVYRAVSLLQLFSPLAVPSDFDELRRDAKADDATGNWNGFDQGVVNALSQTRTQNTINEITDISRTVGALWPTPEYDLNGNTTLFPDRLGAVRCCAAIGQSVAECYAVRSVGIDYSILGRKMR